MNDDSLGGAGRRRSWLAPLALLDGAIARLEAVVLVLGVLAMAAISIANVVGRFVLGESIFFAGEVNQFLVVLITFFGIGYAARQGRHIRMTAFYDALADRPRKWLMILICLGTAAAMFVLAWYAYVYVSGVARTGRIAPALGIPIWWPLVWTPVGFAITGVQYLLTAVVNATQPGVWLSTHVVDSYDDEPTQV
ncbi:MAG: TRAP transporter small permease [Rubrimonas sp.]|uniref:TRAP transporter small permease n=1 Tax=Rubrimonas sp. TaxID=2036015 RepID=UPI002FDDBF9E